MEIYIVEFLCNLDGEISFETFPFTDIKTASEELTKIKNDMFENSLIAFNKANKDDFKIKSASENGLLVSYSCTNTFRDSYFEIKINKTELK